MSRTIEEKVEKQRERAEQIKAIKYAFRGRKGKLALELLSDIGFVNKSTYVKGDPMGTALNEGNRQIILKIMEFIAMSDEQIERKTEEKIKTIRQHERRTDSTGSISIA